MTNKKREVVYENLSRHFHHIFETEEFKGIGSKVIRENLKNLKGVVELPERDDDNSTAVADIDPANQASIDMANSMGGSSSGAPTSPCIPLTLVQSQVSTSIRSKDNLKIETGTLIESTRYTGEKLSMDHIMKDFKGNPIEINSRFDFIPIYVYKTRSNIKKNKPKTDWCKSTATYMTPDKMPHWAPGGANPKGWCWRCPYLKGNHCPSTLKIMGIGFDYSKLITLNFKGPFIWETYLGGNRGKKKKHIDIPLKNFLDQHNPMYKKTLVFEVALNEGFTKDNEPCNWCSIEWRAQRDTNPAIQQICQYLKQHLVEYHNARKSHVWGLNSSDMAETADIFGGGLPNDSVDNWHDEVD